MGSEMRAGSRRSSWRTRLPHLAGCRAPGGVGGSRGAAAPAPLARLWSARPCADPCHARLGGSSCGLPARKVL